ncbi:hypothetical protein GIB67_022591, partial [Kingdonia uniflora]
PRPLDIPLEPSYLDTVLREDDERVNKIFAQLELPRVRVSNKDYKLKGVIVEKKRQSKRRRPMGSGSGANAVDVDQLDEVPSSFQALPRDKVRSDANKTAAGKRGAGKKGEVSQTSIRVESPSAGQKRRREEPHSSIVVVEERPEVDLSTIGVDHHLEALVQKDPAAVVRQIELCFREASFDSLCCSCRVSKVFSVGCVLTKRINEESRVPDLEKHAVDLDRALSSPKRSTQAKVDTVVRAKEEEFKVAHDQAVEAMKIEHEAVVAGYEARLLRNKVTFQNLVKEKQGAMDRLAIHLDKIVVNPKSLRHYDTEDEDDEAIKEEVETEHGLEGDGPGVREGVGEEVQDVDNVDPAEANMTVAPVMLLMKVSCLSHRCGRGP